MFQISFSYQRKGCTRMHDLAKDERKFSLFKTIVGNVEKKITFVI